LAYRWQRLVSCFRSVAFSINMMKQVDLDNCKSKRHFACGLVECMKSDYCEFSINCADSGKYCRHPSIQYSEAMDRELIAMSGQVKAADSAARM
jgi:hypothetical protein